MASSVSSQAVDQLIALLLAEERRLATAMMPSLHLPDVEEYWTPDPVVGYRYWRMDPSRPFLIGPNGVPWRNRKLTAHHNASDHKAPTWGCNCGINAAKEMERVFHLASKNRGDEYVFGVVHLTGIVHEYEKGYRAEKGEIVSLAIFALPTGGFQRREYFTRADHLHLAKRNAAMLRERYKVPVDIVRT
jgi:hypothetical protein